MLLDYKDSQLVLVDYQDKLMPAIAGREAVLANALRLAQAAQALGVMDGRPALLLRRLNYDQHGRVLDLDIEYWRHDSLRIEVDTH